MTTVCLDSGRITDEASEEDGCMIENEVGDFHNDYFRGCSTQRNMRMAWMYLARDDINKEVIGMGRGKRIVDF